MNTISNTDVATVVNKIGSLLGASHVVTASAGDVGPYQDKVERLARSSADGEPREIIAVATPAGIEDLQGVLKLVEGTALTVWSMPNAGGLGSTPPPESGDILMLDLKRMNGILEINTTAAYALVEPGVTYQQLQAHLRENDIPFWVDVDKHSDHSIADSISAREFGYTPYGDHLLMQCGMEVMLASGSVVRTGMGAMPGSNAWQLFKYGYGPYVDGLFTQSNLGIITKIGFWLMPAPPAYKPFMVQLADETALASAIDTLHSLKVNMLIANTVLVSGVRHDAVQYGGEPVDSEANAETLAATHKVGVWNVYGALYGIPDNVDIVWGAISGALGAIPGAQLKLGSELADNPIWANRELAMRGELEASKSDSDHGYIHFTLGSAIEGSDAKALNTSLQSFADKHGVTALTEFALTWRTMMARVSLSYRRGDTDSLRKSRACAQDMLAELASQGYGATHADSDILLNATEAFTNGGIGVLQQRVKKALDPGALFG